MQDIPQPIIEHHFHKIVERLIGFEEWCAKNSEELRKKSALNKLIKKYEK